ncbi:DMT family transporter [Telmatospirillum siberiense]|uniref:Multidrug DMT transporter permease n=1 Tax=Telmatospirillum siberiense TaxID=382514 RepID=A0A2N3PXY7_9PROT|nr:EamA family transporter [Telmatospirillum siberiense]PKU25268.1 multidrug DMT transporter permease [Telmatospirillum siberiense]
MRFFDLLGLLLVQVLWGFHWAVLKFGLKEFPTLLLMGMRFAIVAALLCPFFRISRKQLLPVFGLSLTFGTLNFGLMYAGVAHLDASTAAIIGQAQVPFAAILAAYFYNDRFGWRRLAGLALSFLGIILIVGEPRIGGNFIWVACILGSALAAAFGNIQIKALGPINSFALSGWIALFTAPQMLLASFCLESGQWQALANSTWRGWSSLCYTVLVVSIGTYYLWYPLIRRYPVNQVMPFTLLVPVFGVVSGILMLGETLNLRTLLGSVATIAGVATIVLRRPDAGKPSPSART